MCVCCLLLLKIKTKVHGKTNEHKKRKWTKIQQMRVLWKQCYTLITEMLLGVSVCLEVSHHRNVRILCATKNKIGIKMKRHRHTHTQTVKIRCTFRITIRWKSFLVFPKIAKWANNYVYGKQFSFCNKKRSGEITHLLFARMRSEEHENGKHALNFAKTHSFAWAKK